MRIRSRRKDSRYAELSNSEERTSGACVHFFFFVLSARQMRTEELPSRWAPPLCAQLQNVGIETGVVILIEYGHAQ